MNELEEKQIIYLKKYREKVVREFIEKLADIDEQIKQIKESEVTDDGK